MSLVEEKKKRVALAIIRIVHEVDEGMRMGVRLYRSAANHAASLPNGPEKNAAEAEATALLKRAARLPYRVEARILNLINIGGWSVAQINNALALVSTETVAALQAHLDVLKTYSDVLKDNFQNQGWTESQIADDIEANRPMVDPMESVPLPVGYEDDF